MVSIKLFPLPPQYQCAQSIPTHDYCTKVIYQHIHSNAQMWSHQNFISTSSSGSQATTQSAMRNRRRETRWTTKATRRRARSCRCSQMSWAWCANNRHTACAQKALPRTVGTMFTNEWLVKNDKWSITNYARRCRLWNFQHFVCVEAFILFANLGRDIIKDFANCSTSQIQIWAVPQRHVLSEVVELPVWWDNDKCEIQFWAILYQVENTTVLWLAEKTTLKIFCNSISLILTVFNSIFFGAFLKCGLGPQNKVLPILLVLRMSKNMEFWHIGKLQNTFRCHFTREISYIFRNEIVTLMWHMLWLWWGVLKFGLCPTFDYHKPV